MWQNDTGWKGGDRPAGGNRSGSVRGWPGRSDLFAGPLRRAHLLTTRKRAVVLPPAVVRSPRGGPPDVPSLASMDRPADAIGGLCIGRSCADALGAWGRLATNKRASVHTGALLATTISAYKRGLKVVCCHGILYFKDSDEGARKKEKKCSQYFDLCSLGVRSNRAATFLW